MSIFTSYPEIDSFFKLDSFDEQALQALRDAVANSYRGKELNKANQYIDLKLLGYKLASVEKPPPKKIKKEHASSSDLKSNEAKPKKVELRLLKGREQISVAELAGKLKWTERRVLNLVYQRLTPQQKDVLSKEELLKCNDFIKARLKALKKAKRKFAFKRRKSRLGKSSRSSKSNGVWDKMATYGSGKIIYIRSK